MLTAIRNWVIRTLMKSQTGVMRTLPRKKVVDFNVAMTAERLMRNGIDPNSLKNANQVENAINQVESAEKANLAKNIRGGIRSAKIFDMEGKEIPKGSKIMGGKEVNQKRTFKGVEVKDPTFDLTMPYDNDAEKLAEIKMSNEAYEQELERKIKARLDKGNKEGIARIKNKNMVKDAIDNASPGFVSGDKKYNAQLVAEDLAERKFGKEFYDLDQRQQMDLYDEALEGLAEQTRGMPDPEDFAQGGRAGFFLGSASKFPKGLATLREIINAVTRKSDVIKKPSRILSLTNPKKLNKFLNDPNKLFMKAKEGIMGTDIFKDAQTKLAKDRIKTVRDLLESGKNLKALDNTRAELIDMYMKEIMRKGNFNKEQAKGIVTQLVDTQVGKSSGAKLTDEGISQLENILKNMETGGKKARDLNADGGRIGFKDGMTRRTFLKIFGGLVSLPIIGKVLAPLKLAKGVKKVPIIKTDNVPGKPEWFDQLVNKVIVEGDDVTKRFATAERQSIHQKTLDDGSVVRVTEDVDDGAVRVEYESKESMFGEPVQMQYKKPKPDEGDPRPAAEFEVSESGFVMRPDGPDDFSLEGEDMIGSSIRELESDVSKLKQYATGKGPTMKEIVQIKKRKDKVKRLNEGDPTETSQYVSERQPEPDIEYGIAEDKGDFASGGIARMLGE